MSVRSSEHTLYLNIPARWMSMDSTRTCKGWRAFFILWRISITVRREPLGGIIPRHGLFIFFMTPWTCLVLNYRARDWNSLTLKTAISLSCGRDPLSEIPYGSSISYNHFWSKEFWQCGLMEYYF